MSQPLYISSTCTISPQHTYDAGCFLDPMVSSGDGKLYVIDPDYSRYISPVAIRRMSRMLKRGITAGMRCLEEAAIAIPDAIIIGTAHGSISDMETFLKDMIGMDEQALNPTSFIQSTYNSVNGWLAMLSKCSGYNQTYVHRGFSLELCLLDAQLLLAESNSPKYILAGCFDELTQEYFTIRSKIGYYKKQIPNTLELFNYCDSSGSIAGEGAHFFALSNSPAKAACAIHGIQMLHQPTSEELATGIAECLQQNGLVPDEIDVLILGLNGDSSNFFLAGPIIAGTPARTTVAAFKHLCGEYHTASGFGLWLAEYLFRKQQIPPGVIYRTGETSSIKKILFCNITIAGNVSLIVIKGT